MAVIFYFLFIDHLGMEITSWLCMISAAPFAALGFIRFQGMNAEQIVICAIRSLLIKQHNLIFKPQNLYYEYLKEFLEIKRKESIDPYDKKLRKIEKAKQRKISVPKSAQDLIDIDTIYKDGIFVLRTSILKHIGLRILIIQLLQRMKRLDYF